MSGTSGPSSSLNEIYTFIDRVNIGFAALTMNNDRTVCPRAIGLIVGRMSPTRMTPSPHRSCPAISALSFARRDKSRVS